jgi:predicted GNAT family acetyltransferase
LTVDDLAEAQSLMLADPDACAVVWERIVGGELDPMASGGRVFGWYAGGSLRSFVYLGANLCVVNSTPEALTAFSSFLRRRSRVSSAIVGYRDDVLPLWSSIESVWGPCREVRPNQPLLVVATDPLVQAAPRLRQATLPDLDRLMQPSVDMFTEEVGVSPIAGGRGPAFRARIAASILEGRTYLQTDGDRVVFKAEVGAVGGQCAQVQGVWLTPELRGQGLAAGCIASLVTAVREDHAPRVSLYVNDHNMAAYRAYRRVGFQQVGTFATVLF